MEVLSSRVIVVAQDFVGMRFFYEQLLGVRIYREYGTRETVTGVVYFLGGGFLELVGHGTSSSPVTLWLQVLDAVSEQDRLRALGVRVRKTVERMPWGLIEGWVTDPEGNELRLVEVPPDHPLRYRVE